MGKTLFVFKTDKDLKRLGNFFKKKREQRSILQGSLAKGNIHQGYLSRRERPGQVWNPTLKTLIALLKKLNYEIIIREKSQSKTKSK